jgi:DNA repair protein RecO (recombination protein O)
VNKRHVKTKAVALTSTKFGEGHKLVRLYTEKLGRLEATAFGARKTKSRFGSKLEPFTSGLFLLYRKNENSPFSIQDVDVDRQNTLLRSDLNRFLIANAVVEPVLRFVERMHSDRELFEVLWQALAVLDSIDIRKGLFLLSMFDLNFLSIMGYKPDVYTCVQCSRDLEEIDIYTDTSSGFPVCSSCRTTSAIAVSSGAARFVDWVLQSPLHLSEKVSMQRETLDQVRGIVQNLFLCYFQKTPESWLHMKNMLNIETVMQEGQDR